MNTSLTNIADSIRQINRLLEKYEQSRSLSLDDKKMLFSIYKECKDTNAIIASATQAVNAGERARIISEAKQVLDTAKEFKAIYDRSATLFDTFDTQADITAYLQPLVDEIKAESKIAKGLREDMRTIDHRMSNVWVDSPEYAEYSQQYDAVKDKQDEVAAHIDKLYKKKRQLESELAPLFYFDMTFVVVLINRIAQIADSIVANVDSFDKHFEFEQLLKSNGSSED